MDLREFHTDAQLTPLPDSRVDEIVAEVTAAKMNAEDTAMRDKMSGLRCFSCECWIGGEPKSGNTRYCADCADDIRQVGA